MTQWVQSLLESIGYGGLLFLMALEQVFPPIPSEVVLPLTGYHVFTGDMTFFLAWPIATLGSVIGSFVLYELGRRGGRPLVLRYRRVLRLKDKDLDRADRWFDRHGNATILLARMVPLVRSVVSVPAGTFHMSRVRFGLLTALGSGVWNALLIGGGAALGERWVEVGHVVDSALPFILVVVGLIALVLFVKRRRAAVAPTP